MSTSEQTTQRRQYWRRAIRTTMVLLAIWFVVTYVVSWFAVELNQITFLGFPLGFYMGAQGSLIVYVGLIVYYAWYMNRLDNEYNVAEEG